MWSSDIYSFQGAFVDFTLHIINRLTPYGISEIQFQHNEAEAIWPKPYFGLPNDNVS